MKKISLLFAVLLSTGLFFTACEDESSDDSCSSLNVGEDLCSNDIELYATFCSDGETSYYTYNGNKYECASADDCTDALDKISDALMEDGCQPAKSATLKITPKALELLNEVKVQSLCH